MSNSIVQAKAEAKSNSSVKIVGTVVRKTYREEKDYIILIVATSAKSSKSNYPRVLFFGKDAKDINDRIEVDGNRGPCVEVTGFIRTKKKDIEGQKPVYLHSIIGDSVSLAKTQLEAAGSVGGRRPVPDENAVHMEGKIVNIFDFGKGVILTFSVDRDGKRSSPKMTCFGSHAEFAKTLEEGDFVSAAGMVQTARKKDRDGKIVFYESVVCTDIDKNPEL